MNEQRMDILHCGDARKIDEAAPGRMQIGQLQPAYFTDFTVK